MALRRCTSASVPSYAHQKSELDGVPNPLLSQIEAIFPGEVYQEGHFMQIYISVFFVYM